MEGRFNEGHSERFDSDTFFVKKKEVHSDNVII